MSTPERRAEERLRYWQGQTLRSKDFRDQDRLDAARRAQHVAALHRAYGVSEGLVASETAQGISVTCGVAYDCNGRALVLQRALELDATDVITAETDAYVVLRARSSASASADGCGCSVPFDPGCAIEGAGDAQEDVELAWVEEAVFDARAGVALARFTANGTLDAEWKPRTARPLARPRILHGQTVRGNTPWEPWTVDDVTASGVVSKRILGVQTRVDATAAGFTDIPCYFAALESPGWDLAKSAFAPAFFSQIADPTVDGFLFRLLMVQTGRRRYQALADTTRVSSVARGDAAVSVVVAVAAPFREGDSVALLEPRGTAAIFIQDIDDKKLTLAGPFPAGHENELIALGNAPRRGLIVSAPTAHQTAFVSFKNQPGPKKSDVLVRSNDASTTVVDAAKGTPKVLTVLEPFAGWTKEESVRFALRTGAQALKNQVFTPDGTVFTATLPSNHPTVSVNDVVVLMNDKKQPFAKAGKVTKIDGNDVELSVPSMAVSADAVEFLSLARAELEVTDVRFEGGTVVQIDTPGAFQEGDFVASPTNPTAVTVVETIDGDELTLRDALQLVAGDHLVVANWLCATTVIAVRDGTSFFVGRSNAVRQGSIVARVTEDGLLDAVNVTSVSGNFVTVDRAIDDLARGQVLLMGEFPATVSVVGVDGGLVHVLPGGALRAGDVVVHMNAPGTVLPLLEVASVDGDGVRFKQTFTGIEVGHELAVVHFRDTATLTSYSGVQDIVVNHGLKVRDRDFVGPFSHYVDNSAAAVVTNIGGTTLTLGNIGPAPGDGIVSEDVLEGGIIGQATFSFTSRPLLRLENADGITPGQPRATLFGFNLESGQFQSCEVRLYLVDAATARVYVDAVEPASRQLHFRPEGLQLITTFNADFATAFVTFAQKMELSVAWVGCQDEFRQARGCPLTHPITPEETTPCACGSTS